jgi:hypothetical protein
LPLQARSREARTRVNIFARQSEHFCVDRFGKRTSAPRSRADGVRLVDEKSLALVKRAMALARVKPSSRISSNPMASRAATSCS